MLKTSHANLVFLSGLVWLGVGCFLLPLGLKLIVESSQLDQGGSILQRLSPLFGGAGQAALLLIVLCLFLGYFKGKFVLGKSAKRGVERIMTFPNPTSLFNIYSYSYYLLLAGMVALGMSIKFLGLPNEIRGAVDVAVGSALINGAMIYFRVAYGLWRRV